MSKDASSPDVLYELTDHAATLARLVPARLFEEAFAASLRLISSRAQQTRRVHTPLARQFLLRGSLPHRPARPRADNQAHSSERRKHVAPNRLMARIPYGPSHETWHHQSCHRTHEGRCPLEVKNSFNAWRTKTIGTSEHSGKSFPSPSRP